VTVFVCVEKRAGLSDLSRPGFTVCQLIDWTGTCLIDNTDTPIDLGQ